MEELRKEPVTAGLILLNILVFLIVEFTGSSQNTMHMLDCGAAFTPMIIQGGEYYRLFTCMFLHFGIEHLLNNMLVLFVLGSRLEQAISVDLSDRWSTWKCDFFTYRITYAGFCCISRSIRSGVCSYGSHDLYCHSQ